MKEIHECNFARGYLPLAVVTVPVEKVTVIASGDLALKT